MRVKFVSRGNAGFMRTWFFVLFVVGVVCRLFFVFKELKAYPSRLALAGVGVRRPSDDGTAAAAPRLPRKNGGRDALSTP